MNKQEYLLICLAEEASEVAQATSKVLRFTAEHKLNGQSNLEKLCEEYSQLLAVIDVLQENGVLINFNHLVYKKKLEAIDHYLNISIHLGAVDG